MSEARPCDLPLVSVIIPTYNRREYVCEAIDSALAQTYPNVEIIVVDDGSTDGTDEALAERYGTRIRYEWQENHGESVARNRAIELAKGEYIALLDSDDVWLPHRLSAQMNMLRERPGLVLIAGHVGTIDRQGRLIDGGPRYPYQQEETVQPEEIVLRSPLAASSLLFRRAAAPAPVFRAEIKYGEDWDLCLTLAAVGEVGFCQQVVAYHRSHGGAQTASATDVAAVRRRLSDRTRIIESALSGLFTDSQRRSSLRDRAIAQELSLAAMGHCLGGEFDLAEQQVRETLRLDGARWADGHEVADLARRYIMVEARRGGDESAVPLMDRMFAMLARAVPGFRTVERATRGHVHIELAFLAHQRGDRWPVVRNAIQGLWLAPRWARNRGVWSIMARAAVGQGVRQAPA